MTISTMSPDLERWRPVVEGRKFLWLNVPPWGNVWTRQNHFTQRLARLGAEILYVESARTYLMAAKQRQWNIMMTGSKLHDVEPRLTVMTLPPILPGSTKSNFVGKLVGRKIANYVNAEIRKRGWLSYTVWNRVPLSQCILPHLQPKYSVATYDITDDYSGFSPASRNLTEQRERDLLQSVDLVTVTMDELVKPRHRYNNNIHFISNGVDYDLFAQVGESTLTVATEMAQFPKPVIGYVGLVAEWVDFELVEKLGKKYPGQVVIVGPINGGLMTKVKQIADVHWTGFVKNRSDLPKYIQGMDVCIIPFKVNELTTHMNPLKVWEYLATGKPIVSVDLPALAPCKHVIEIAHNHEEFLMHIERKLTTQENQELITARRNIAYQYSWDNLFGQLMEQLSPLLS